jgi:hypothetical protein
VQAVRETIDPTEQPLVSHVLQNLLQSVRVSIITGHLARQPQSKCMACFHLRQDGQRTTMMH